MATRAKKKSLRGKLDAAVAMRKAVKRKPIRKTIVKGDRVELESGKIGTIMFKGQTTFAKGEWYGLELDLPEGKHDGYIKKDMRRYFKCKKNHGAFVQRKKIVALAGKKKQEAPVDSEKPKDEPKKETNEKKVVVEEKKEQEVPAAPGMEKQSSTTDQVVDRDGNLVRRKLVVEDRVELVDGRTGTIKFIGKTKFAKGEWFGIASEKADGKHDGYVGVKRYFKCSAKHGIFVHVDKIKVLLSREKSKAIKLQRSMKIVKDMIMLTNSGEVVKIRWQGNPRNMFGSLHYGVELRDGGGDCDGFAHKKQFFKTPPNKAKFIPRKELAWILENKEWNKPAGTKPNLPHAK